MEQMKPIKGAGRRQTRSGPRDGCNRDGRSLSPHPHQDAFEFDVRERHLKLGHVAQHQLRRCRAVDIRRILQKKNQKTPSASADRGHCTCSVCLIQSIFQGFLMFCFASSPHACLERCEVKQCKSVESVLTNILCRFTVQLLHLF